MGSDVKPRVGEMLRGQAWVELHGVFSAPQLESLAGQLRKNLVGLERHDDRAERRDH